MCFPTPVLYFDEFALVFTAIYHLPEVGERSIAGCEYSKRILRYCRVGVKVGLKEVLVVGNSSIETW